MRQKLGAGAAGVELRRYHFWPSRKVHREMPQMMENVAERPVTLTKGAGTCTGQELRGRSMGVAPRSKSTDEKAPPIRSCRRAGSGRVGDRARWCCVGGQPPALPFLDLCPADTWRNT